MYPLALNCRSVAAPHSADTVMSTSVAHTPAQASKWHHAKVAHHHGMMRTQGLPVTADATDSTMTHPCYIVSQKM
jgi:hypothetical protein